MKKIYIFFLSILSLTSVAQFNYERAWGTYYGGHDFFFQTVKTDPDGNIYIIGGGRDFTNIEAASYYSEFTTFGATQESFDNSSSVILKLSPTGTVLWCTYLGLDIASLPIRDQIADIAFDSDDNIYVIGNINDYQGNGIITEPADFNLFSVTKKGFISKFNSEGAQVWGKWVPFYPTKLLIDNSDWLNIAGFTDAQNIGTAGAFQQDYLTGGPFERNALIAKYDVNGNKIWLTYNGTGTGANIVLDENNNIYAIGSVLLDDNFYSTPGSFQSQSDFTIPQGQLSSFISKFTPDGQRIWSTYFGLSNNITNTGINGIIYRDGFLYLTGGTNVNDGIITMGTYQSNPVTPFIFTDVNPNSNSSDGFVTKFDSNGNRIWGTYFGGEKTDVCTAIQVNDESVFVSGLTYSSGNIATPDAFQPLHSATVQHNGFIANLTLDGTTKNWGTYYGGQGLCENISMELTANDTLHIAGTTQSDDGIATLGAIQPLRNTGLSETPEYVYNMFIARFDQIPLSTRGFDLDNLDNLTLYPNPNNGNFMLQGNLKMDDDILLSMFDSLGRLVSSEKINDKNILNHEITIGSKISKGVYFAKLQSGTKTVKTFKVVVE